MNEIDKLAWLYLKEGKLLVAKSKGKNLYYVPGGKREAGESDEQALMREIKEELSVDLIPSTIKYAGIFKSQADEKNSGITVKMTCYFADYTGKLQADSEIDELAWLGYKERTQCSAVTQIIMDWLVSQETLT